MAPPSTKTLIVTRHAHRDKAQGREVDNGLSEKGLQQAKRLTQYFEKKYGGKKPHVMSSPKVRCQETVQAIADITKRKLEISDLLDEQHEGESSKAYKKKVEEFLRWWKEEGPPLLIINSHGDWIPLFFEIAIGTCLDLKKGAWAELELDDNTPKLTWLLQEL